MKPRIRTVPPRVATLAIAAGVAAFALPAAANATVTPQIDGTASPDADRRRRGRRRSRSASTRRQHHPQLRRRQRPVERHGLRPGPGRRTTCRPTARSRWSSTPPAATTTSTSRPRTSQDADDQRRRRRRHDHRLRGRRRDRRRQRQRPHHRFRGNETIHGGEGNDVIIWNNADGNDINEGDAGVDETLIVEAGVADDGNVVTQDGAITQFDRVSGAGAFNVSTPTRWRS